MADIKDIQRAYSKAVDTWTVQYKNVVGPEKPADVPKYSPPTSVPQVVLDRYLRRWLGDAGS